MALGKGRKGGQFPTVGGVVNTRKGGQFPGEADNPWLVRRKSKGRPKGRWRERGRRPERAVLIKEENRRLISIFAKRTRSQMEGNRVFVKTKKWDGLGQEGQNQIRGIALRAGMELHIIGPLKKPRG